MSVPRKPRKPSKSPAKKRAYHHGDLRRALLDASLALIVEQGAQAFTLREAARRAGVSQAAPYRHFADKDTLLAAIAEEGFRRLTARMREEKADAAGELASVGLGYLLFAAENPAHYRVMFGGSAHAATAKNALPPSLQQAGDESFAVLTDAIRAAQAAGQVRAGDVDELALFSWSVVHGFALLVIDGVVPVADKDAFRVLAVKMLSLSVEGTAAR